MFESQRVFFFIYYCKSVKGKQLEQSSTPLGKRRKKVVFVGNSAKLFKLGFPDNAGPGIANITCLKQETGLCQRSKMGGSNAPSLAVANLIRFLSSKY